MAAPIAYQTLRYDPGVAAASISFPITIGGSGVRSIVIVCGGPESDFSPAVAFKMKARVIGVAGRALGFTREIPSGGGGYENRKMWNSDVLPAGTYSCEVSVTGGTGTFFGFLQLTEIDGIVIAAAPGGAIYGTPSGGTIIPSPGNVVQRYGPGCALLSMGYNQGPNFTGFTLPAGFTQVINANEMVAYKASTTPGVFTQPLTMNVTGDAGGTALLLVICNDATYLAGLSTGITLPLTPHASGRYYKDATGMPVIVRGSTPWGIAAATLEQTRREVNTRILQGFNTAQVMWPAHPVQVGSSDQEYETCADWAGNLPYLKNLAGSTWVPVAPYANAATDAADLSQPNDAYWDARVLQALEINARGMQIVIDPDFFNNDALGWFIEFTQNSALQCAALGTYIGGKYYSVPAVTFLLGGDLTYTATAQITAFWTALIAASPSTHQFGTHMAPPSHAQEQATYKSTFTFDPVYVYNTPAGESLEAYAEVTPKPAVMIETAYEDNPFFTREQVRAAQILCAMNGVAGYTYGHYFGYPFREAWFQYMESPGVADCVALNSLIASVAWHTLVPSNALVTGNPGTIDTTTYNSFGKNPAGTLGIGYSASAASSPTLNLSSMGGPGRYQYLDPTTLAVAASGTYAAATGQVLTRPAGSNTAGSTDWLLLLVSPLATQHSYRWFKDDGSESASTAQAALNTGASMVPGQMLRLRTLIDFTGDVARLGYKPQYRKVGETPWKDATP